MACTGAATGDVPVTGNARLCPTTIDTWAGIMVNNDMAVDGSAVKAAFTITKYLIYETWTGKCDIDNGSQQASVLEITSDATPRCTTIDSGTLGDEDDPPETTEAELDAADVGNQHFLGVSNPHY